MLLLQNRYRALSLIGQGGFGRTFLAIETVNPQRSRCVIKQFFPPAMSPESQARASELFRQEAVRLQELGHHPQIPTLLDYVEQDGQQFLVQEFINGRNLEQELLEEGPFSEAKIRQLLETLLPIVQFIHDRQVIHRDIKPANLIRRSSDQQLFLVDLGAAKQATSTTLAQTGTVIGSAEFTAPEQARGKAVFASDLYSLGVTCIHLLTQISPFDLFDSSDDRWIWRDYLLTPVSPCLQYVLDKLLQRALSLRYPSAQAALTDLAVGKTADPKPMPLGVKPELVGRLREIGAVIAARTPGFSLEKDRSSTTAGSEQIWPEEDEEVPVWAEDADQGAIATIASTEKIWSEEQEVKIWAEESAVDSAAQKALWLRIVIGLLAASPVLLMVWNKWHAPS